MASILNKGLTFEKKKAEETQLNVNLPPSLFFMISLVIFIIVENHLIV
jgi:hypothetical protein